MSEDERTKTLSQPQPDIYKLVKTLRKTPLVLTGIILQILKNWFKANSDQFKYVNNELESKLVIEPSFLWNPENCQNRPGLFVKRGGYSPKGMGKAGMGDLLKLGKNAEAQYTVLPACPLMIFCIGKMPGEVEELAWEASTVLIGMAPIIRKDFNFIGFDVDNVGEIGQVEEYKEFWTVPISITTRFAETWEVQQVAPVLKKVLVNAYSTLIGELEKGFSRGDYSSGSQNK